MFKGLTDLPIFDVADAIVEGVAREGRVVLSAPTGSGKSTQVPQILLDRCGIEGEIVVLQPRRLAARMLAGRVAAERGGRPGGEVGFQIRFENATGPGTRIRFVTEAILLRRILSDPDLKGVGGIVFDEFHERHLSGDVSLACALESLRKRRPDLKLVVMSATLETERLETYLQPAARVLASGRTFPVEVAYAGAALGRQAAPVWERAARAFRGLVREGMEGDVLVFMPGAFEIRRTITAVEALPEAKGYEVLPLHGELSPEAQDRAVGAGDRAKVIVSTNVAETSITIEGVCAVIDGGLARVARFDPRRGLNSLLVEPISRASAEQRAGRAGRTGPGRCVRLWSEKEHTARPERDTAEVARVDLSDMVLLLAVAGVRDINAFPWFEAPTAIACDRAVRLLSDLGAVEGDQADLQVTEMGRRMAGFPLHPRMARMLIEGSQEGVLEAVCRVAAMSQGRPFYRAVSDGRARAAQRREIEDKADLRSDFLLHLRAWEFAQGAKFKREACEGVGIHAVAARQAGEAARQLVNIAKAQGLEAPSRGGAPTGREAGDSICRCLLAGFPDQLAKRKERGTRRCQMVHGRTGELRRESVVESELMVAAEIEEREVRGEVTVLLGMATAVEEQWLVEMFPGDFEEATSTTYDPQRRRVVAQTERRFRDLILEVKDSGEPDPKEASRLLAAEVLAGNLRLKQWDASVDTWVARVNFVAEHCPETEIAPIDGEVKGLLVEQICQGALSYKEIKDRPVLPVLKEWVGPEQRYFLDAYAPPEMELPRRKRPVKIRYQADGRAVIASKLQDFYDVRGEHLRVAGGKVPLLIELLAPNGRPVHLTDDLDGFWNGAYGDVRKELAGRYPKHEWR